MQASSHQRRSPAGKQPDSGWFVRVAIAAILFTLALWLAVAIFIAGLRWAVSGETDVPVGGPQTRLSQDFAGPFAEWGWPGSGGEVA